MTGVNGEIRIAPLADTDIAAVIALASEIWNLHYPGIISVAQIDYMLGQRYSAEAIRRQLAGGRAWWDTLFVDGRLAGFASIEAGGRPQADKLDKIYLHPRFQGCGLGSRLLAHVAAGAGARGSRRLWLQVNKHNRRAIEAYLRNGYRIVESVTADIGQGFVMDDYIMERLIGQEASQNRREVRSRQR